MDYLDSFLVALLQGITEFLPISSSGHIVLVQALLGQDLEIGMTFNIITHFGTLCSIVIFFFQDLKAMVKSGYRLILHPAEVTRSWDHDEATRFNIYVLVSMIPAGIVGFTVRDQLDTLFSNPLGVSFMFLFTGIFLYATRFFDRGSRNLNIKNTFIIGLAQAVSLIPGISRSGATISMGVFLGVNREDIARFTFIMMLPVVAGATFVELLDIGTGQIGPSIIPHLILGFFVSMVSGYYALKYLIRLFKSKGIHYFAWYCWAVGLLGLIYF